MSEPKPSGTEPNENVDLGALATYTEPDALTYQEQRFVMFSLKGMGAVPAARAAGYVDDMAGPKLLKDKKIRKAMENAVHMEFLDTQVTREKLTTMLFEAHSHAVSATEEINAVRELGKMHGTYEATKIAQTIDLNHKITNVRQLEQLDDAALAELAGEKLLFDPADAIEGEFTDQSDETERSKEQ